MNAERFKILKIEKDCLLGILNFSSGFRIKEIQVKSDKNDVLSKNVIFDIIRIVANIFYLQLFLLKLKWKWKCKSEVAQSCLTLCDPVDCILPGSSFHGVLQEWVAISFSRGSSQPRDRTQVSHIAGRRFTLWVTREACSLILKAFLKWQVLSTFGKNVVSLKTR